MRTSIEHGGLADEKTGAGSSGEEGRDEKSGENIALLTDGSTQVKIS
jgi:hypothetical protein